MKLILYDLDGTLLDSFEDIRASVNHGLRRMGLPERSIDEIKRFVGDGVEKLVERALGPAAAHRFDEALAAVLEHYKANPAESGRPYPGALAALDRARAAGLKQAIVTNKPHAIALASCARTGLAERVDRVQGAGDGFPLKPDPAVAFALMQEFGATAAETALLGDGNADAALARAAGIAFVGCAWGSNSTDRLRELGARRVIESFGEWPGVLNGIERRV